MLTGLPQVMSRKWARRESTATTHRSPWSAIESDQGHLGTVLRTHSQPSVLEQTLVLPGTTFQCPLLLLCPLPKTREWTFNNILSSQNEQQRFFQPHTEISPSSAKHLKETLQFYDVGNMIKTNSGSKQFPRKEKGDRLSKCVHSFWNRNSGKLNATFILED